MGFEMTLWKLGRYYMIISEFIECFSWCINQILRSNYGHIFVIAWSCGVTKWNAYDRTQTPTKLYIDSSNECPSYNFKWLWHNLKTKFKKSLFFFVAFQDNGTRLLQMHTLWVCLFWNVHQLQLTTVWTFGRFV